MLKRLVLWVCLVWPSAVVAQDVSALNTAGTFAMMRHALAPGTSDPAGFALGACDTQRNLDDLGRDQAWRIGEALRAAGVHFDHVWTSQWCRCVETATLLNVGEVKELPALNSFFGDPARAGRQIGELLSVLDALPEDERALFVTHQVNITALTGVLPASGEIVILRLSDADDFEVLDRIAIPP